MFSGIVTPLEVVCKSPVANSLMDFSSCVPVVFGNGDMKSKPFFKKVHQEVLSFGFDSEVDFQDFISVEPFFVKADWALAIGDDSTWISVPALGRTFTTAQLARSRRTRQF